LHDGVGLGTTSGAAEKADLSRWKPGAGEKRARKNKKKAGGPRKEKKKIKAQGVPKEKEEVRTAVWSSIVAAAGSIIGLVLVAVGWSLLSAKCTQNQPQTAIERENQAEPKENQVDSTGCTLLVNHSQGTQPKKEEKTEGKHKRKLSSKDPEKLGEAGPSGVRKQEKVKGEAILKIENEAGEQQERATGRDRKKKKQQLQFTTDFVEMEVASEVDEEETETTISGSPLKLSTLLDANKKETVLRSEKQVMGMRAPSVRSLEEVIFVNRALALRKACAAGEQKGKRPWRG
jgi:hypothetical protein